MQINTFTRFFYCLFRGCFINYYDGNSFAYIRKSQYFVNYILEAGSSKREEDVLLLAGSVNTQV